MCERLLSEGPFLILYCSDKYSAQRMCNKAADDSLAALKLIFDWFVTSKMIKEYFTALYVNGNTLMKILVMSYFLVIKWLFLM